ncbi:hypothetical protein niasHT_033316 [Heterodera trifolii]|uniref:Uncharacterized protein n=1 Tax=Heterodera trifolii TaxID=157864 RepID=A0ABD2ID79_9BILA
MRQMALALSFSATFVLLATLFPSCVANTECVWATGLVKCNKNQTKVLGAVVELWDLDSPQNTDFQNPLDSDDKATFTEVDDPTGLWKLDGCASDHDWFSINRPEFYLRVYHQCNTDNGEWLSVWPIFRVYTPRTYDWHIEHPIVLDAPVPSTVDGLSMLANNGTVVAPSNNAGGVFGQTSFMITPPPLTLGLPYNNQNNSNNAENGKGAETGDEGIVSDGTRRNNAK